MSPTLCFLKTEFPHELLAFTMISLQYVELCRFLYIAEPPAAETDTGNLDEVDGQCVQCSSAVLLLALSSKPLIITVFSQFIQVLLITI